MEYKLAQNSQDIDYLSTKLNSAVYNIEHVLEFSAFQKRNLESMLHISFAR